MSQPDDELASKVVNLLDSGADKLAPSTRQRLAAARGLALSRYQAEPQPVRGVARVLNVVGHGGLQGHHGARQLLVAGALVLALIGIGYWQIVGFGNGDPNEIDAELLTGELPINAYLDKGFDSWLKRASR